MFSRKDEGALAAEKHRKFRSHAWDEVRKQHLSIEPNCAACPRKKRGIWTRIVSFFRPVEVHQIFPFHITHALERYDLEIDPRNLITLCEKGPNHHLLLGHLGDWQSFNRNIREHASRIFYGKTAQEITTSAVYETLTFARPKDFVLWTEQEKAACRVELDGIFPIQKQK